MVECLTQEIKKMPAAGKIVKMPAAGKNSKKSAAGKLKNGRPAMILQGTEEIAVRMPERFEVSKQAEAGSARLCLFCQSFLPAVS